MKKLFCVALVLCMIFALSACGEKKEPSSSAPSSSTPSSSEVASSEPEQSQPAESSSEVTSSEPEQVDVSELNNAVKTAKLGGVLTQAFLVRAFEAKTFEASDGTQLGYRLYVPSTYDENVEYPVLVFLHGAGERGSDNVLQLNNMALEIFSANTDVVSNSIVIAPQCPADNQWVDTPWALGNYSVDNVPESNELIAVTELLANINKTYSTDKNRQYVTGLSMGGFGTWDLIMRHTDMFTAAVPVCGGADPSQAQKLKDFPIFTAHGDADPTVPVAGTSEMVSAIKSAGGTKITYDEVAGYGHNVWDYTATQTDAFEWLYSQTK